MFKQNLLKSAALTTAVICLFLFAACNSEQTNANTEHPSSQTDAESETEQTTPTSPTTETPSEPTEPAPTSQETEPSSAPSGAPEEQNNEIAKINGGADETGIYSIVVRLTDKAADKGKVEMVYYGAKNSPQENSVVNTFRIEYYKEPSGTFKIQTFFDGEVYQSFKQDEVKVTNTFGANLRAGNVIISYTPDGGDTQEIFRADAEYFYVSAN